MMTGTWSTVALMMGRSIMPMGVKVSRKRMAVNMARTARLRTCRCCWARGVWVFIFNYLQAAVPDGRDTARIWMQPQAEMGLPSPSGEYSGPPPGTAEAIITVISSDCNPIVENLRLFWYNWMTIYGA